MLQNGTNRVNKRTNKNVLLSNKRVAINVTSGHPETTKIRKSENLRKILITFS